MKQNKKLLSNEISIFIKANVINPRKVKDISKAACDSELADKIPMLEINKIFKLRVPIFMLTEVKLCALTMYLNKTLDFGVDIEQWFESHEIQESLTKDTNAIVRDGKIIFEDVTFNKSDNSPMFRCFVSYKQLKEINDKNMVTYNTSAQRIGTPISRGATTVIIPTIYEDSVKEISELVASEKFKTNDIIFNINKDDEIKKYHYSPVDRTLTIECDLDITDGAHRNYGVLKGLEINPIAEGYLGVTVVNMDTEEAADLVRQIAQTNIHNRELLEKYNEGNAMNIFMKRLNTAYNERENFLYGKIDFLARNDADSPVINYEIMDSVMTSLNMKKKILTMSKGERTELCDFVIDFFTMFADEFSVHENARYLNYNNFLCGLMCTAWALRNKTDRITVKDVKKIINKFDFNKYDYTFKSKQIENNTKREIRENFTALVKGIKVEER